MQTKHCKTNEDANAIFFPVMRGVVDQRSVGKQKRNVFVRRRSCEAERCKLHQATSYNKMHIQLYSFWKRLNVIETQFSNI